MKTVLICIGLAYLAMIIAAVGLVTHTERRPYDPDEL